MAPQNTVCSASQKQDGFVLVTALLFLLLLTMLGIFGLNATNIEMQISGNDLVRKEVFFQADGGAQLAIRLLEENLAWSDAFTSLDNGVLRGSNNTVLIENPSFSKNGTMRFPSDTVRDVAYFPEGFDPAEPNVPHTNITVHCQKAELAPGSCPQMVGYQNCPDKAQISCTLFSQHLGRSGSEAVVQVEWLHVAGLELDDR